MGTALAAALTILVVIIFIIAVRLMYKRHMYNKALYKRMDELGYTDTSEYEQMKDSLDKCVNG